MKVILIIVAALVIIAVPGYFFVTATNTDIQVNPAPKVIGFDTPMQVKLANRHGVKTYDVTLEQDGKSYSELPKGSPAGKPAPETNLNLKLGKGTVPTLHDGKARVVVTVTSNDLRRKTDTKTFDVDVMTEPPHVVADGVQHYINQGGSEMVTFTPSGAWTEAGVKVGDQTFRSFPLPNHPGQYFSLFAFSWNLPVNTPIYVYATNPSGAVAPDHWQLGPA